MQENIQTFHCEKQAGHTFVIFGRHLQWSAMVYDDSKCIKIVGTYPISSHRVTGPYGLPELVLAMTYKHTEIYITPNYESHVT